MDQDIIDKLATGEYSISPRSGRLRKRIKKKKKQSFFSVHSLKKLGTKLIWIVVVLGFLVSLVLVFPELNFVSDNKQINKEKNKQMRPIK